MRNSSTSFRAFSSLLLLLRLLIGGGGVAAAVASTEVDGGAKSSMMEIGTQRLFEHLHDRAILDYNHSDILLRGRQLVTPQTDGTSVVTAAAVVGDDLKGICQAVQDSFTQAVDCRCMGSLHNSFSMSCEYRQELCHESPSAGRTCGQPQIAVSMVEGHIFSSTTCVKNYRRGMLPMEDTCVFVDACPHASSRDGFCGCTASYGGHVCRSCEVCPDGQSISVDCTDRNVEAVTKQCQPVDLDLQLTAGSGSSLTGFAPSFDGFCSQLEQALDNKVTCDCTDAVGGNFALSCQTNEPVCVNDGRHCGDVQSTVEVVDGQMDRITSCAKYTSEPFQDGETCTIMQLCPASTTNTTTTTTAAPSDGEGRPAATAAGVDVCGCWATYNGKKCNSCEVCTMTTAGEGGDDGITTTSGLTLDCSNVHENAIVEQCQPLDLSTSYEFLPNYPVAAHESIVSIGNSKSAAATRMTSPNTPRAGWRAVGLLLGTVGTIWFTALWT
jgi:hypothetical protein